MIFTKEGEMARLPRIVVPGLPMHVIQRGNNRQATFFAEDDYRKYLEVLSIAAEENECFIHAYVLMTNHIHLLVTPTTETSLALMMQDIGRKYVRYINNTYQRTGTLWEGRYKSALVESEQYLLTCSRYIELNPVNAGMVDEPGQYKWSSYHSNALGNISNKLITPHEVYQRLGNSDEQRQKVYKALFENHIDSSTLNDIRESTQKCTIIGNCHFQDEIKIMLKRRVAKYSHGGDRKSDDFDVISSDLTP